MLATFAIIFRSDGGQFDECRHADTAIDALGAQFRLLPAEFRHVHNLQSLVETAVEGQLFELHATRRGSGKIVAVQIVFSADFDRVQTQGLGTQIDQAFGYGAGDGMPDRTNMAQDALVQKGHAYIGPVVLVAIGCAG